MATRAERAARALQPGHDVRLLTGGTAYFDALIAAIDAARAEVLLETYIFDFAGRPGDVAEALARAAARGVCTQVVVDGFGTGGIPAAWEARWKDRGVQWRIFNPVRGWRMLLPRGWRRLHRKLCVVDGAVAFCGGINLLDDFHDPNHGALDEPRFDFAVRVTGPLVADVHETMVRLWLRLQAVREAGQPDVRSLLETVRRAARAGTDAEAPRVSSDDFAADARSPHAGMLAGLLLRDNVRFRKRIEYFYRYAVNQARREITIANAYFVPGIALQRALVRARKRGVKITLLLQGRYEYFMQHHTTRALYGVLLDAGIEIVEYAPSFLHAKVAVFDTAEGAIATVGSSNLDPISLLLAREANVFVRDDRFAGELKAALDAALAAGKRVESKAYLARSFRGRALSWLAYAFMRVALFATRHRY
jgi:cardiolipin synthase